MSFHNKQTIKSGRKNYRCDWCNERINKGETSVVESGLDGPDFWRCRYHPECSKAITRYCSKYDTWGEELPGIGSMNRGGTEERGEPETEPLDTP